MSGISVFATLTLFCAVALLSCNDNDDNNTPAESLVRIQTETDFYDGALEEHALYRFDTYGRIIEVSSIYGYDGDYSEAQYIYNDSLVLGYEFYAGEDTAFAEIHYLNNRGLVDSTLFRYGADANGIIRYNYNNDGYLIWREFRSEDFAMYFEDSYVVENGNITRQITHAEFGVPDVGALLAARLSKPLHLNDMEARRMQRRLENRREQIREQHIYQDTIFFEYLSKPNTLSDCNRGFVWMGKPNKNLVARDIVQNGADSDIYLYEYEFDSKGRVSKQWDPDTENPWVSRFTYTD